tara:strand:+ start:20282 stop:20503 length:222 start_codon:yes stop_codon:yes gene_type:complete
MKKSIIIAIAIGVLSFAGWNKSDDANIASLAFFKVISFSTVQLADWPLSYWINVLLSRSIILHPNFSEIILST